MAWVDVLVSLLAVSLWLLAWFYNRLELIFKCLLPPVSSSDLVSRLPMAQHQCLLQSLFIRNIVLSSQPSTTAPGTLVALLLHGSPMAPLRSQTRGLGESRQLFRHCLRLSNLLPSGMCADWCQISSSPPASSNVNTGLSQNPLVISLRRAKQIKPFTPWPSAMPTEISKTNSFKSSFEKFTIPSSSSKSSRAMGGLNFSRLLEIDAVFSSCSLSVSSHSGPATDSSLTT